MVDGLETWGMEEFMDNGIKAWPDNPFEVLTTISFDYDSGTQGGGDDAKIGTLGQRTDIQGIE